MAAGAFHVDSQKNLRNILGELHVSCLACIDVSAPLDPIDETCGIALSIDQFAGHYVVSFVRPQRVIQPGGDLLATTGDETGPGIVVAQQIIPESQPMIGVGHFSGKQFLDQTVFLVLRRIGEECFKFLGRG